MEPAILPIFFVVVGYKPCNITRELQDKAHEPWGIACKLWSPVRSNIHFAKSGDTDSQTARDRKLQGAKIAR